MGNSKDKPLTSNTNQQYFYGGSDSAGLDQYGNKLKTEFPIKPAETHSHPKPNYRVIGAPKSENSGHFFGGSTKAGQGFGKSEKP